MLLVKQQHRLIMLGNYRVRCLSTVTGVWYTELQTGEWALLSVHSKYT